MLQFADIKAFAEQVANRAHPSAERDPLTRLTHRVFIVVHLAMGVAPLAALPAMLAYGVAFAGPALAAAAWPVAPLLIALYLSKTGDLDRASRLSAFAFAALAAIVAGAQGPGIGSGVAIWLALPLIDAAFAGSRRALASAAIAAVAGLFAGAVIGFATPAGAGAAAMTIGAIAAGVYAVGIAARIALAGTLSTEARRADRAVAELFCGPSSDLVTRHAASGATVFASASAQRLLGAAPRELQGQGVLNRVLIADRPAFLQLLSSAVASGESASIEIRIRREEAAGGAPHYAWFEMRARRTSGAAVALGAEEAVVVAVYRDVTERKRHEEALIAAREEAERANLAKSRFLANMSHELRTPLNAIIGFSEILSDEQLCRLSPERRADYAALIHKSGAHLLEVVNSILDMAKIESGAFTILPEPCSIEPIVAHCASLMELKAESAGVRLTVDLPRESPDLIADGRALTQILLNLLGNALKFTPRGGSVLVSVAARSDGVTLSVKDTGVGIAPEDVARLGEAFFQADSGFGRKHEGSGLGLSVVRGLVGLHHGVITVESELGRGTQVTIFLPRDCRLSQVVDDTVVHASAAAAPSGQGIFLQQVKLSA